MNIAFKKIPIEKTLFFDIEAVRANKELEVGSKEFELYRKKIRNRETDEYPSDEEVLEDYKKRAALKMGYLRIVTIGVGFVRAGEVFIKAITGEEEDILKEFFNILSQFDYVCGVNILGYDLPHCYMNAAKYFDYTSILPDRFVTSGKKPWELKNVVDIMDVVRGTHYANMSLDEMLYHFGLDSSKSDIDGSQVSDVYYSEGVERIAEYVKKDVFACVQLFSKLQFEKHYDDFIDRSSVKTEVKKVSPLVKLYNTDYLSDDIKSEIKSKMSKKRLTKKEKETIQNIIENVYIRTTFMKSDTKEVAESKKAEIAEFFKTV